MRVNRAKFVRKYLKFFHLNFHINPPYHVVLDGNFIYAAIKVKLDIKERLEKLLQGETVRLFVLKSVLTELNAVGPKAAEAFKFAKTFCTVIDDDAFAIADTPAERLVALLRKQANDKSSSSSSGSKHYFVATQDKDLRDRLGGIPGVPLIYMNKVVLVLEAPSSQSKETSLEIEATKVALTPLEAEVLQKVNNKKTRGVNIVGGESIVAGRGAADSSSFPTQDRRKRKATGANPLASKQASQVCTRVFVMC